MICAEFQVGLILKEILRKETSVIEKMANTLSKRGPDETNIWNDTHVGFGHKRLIVVDPEGGRQPMSNHKPWQHLYHLLQW